MAVFGEQRCSWSAFCSSAVVSVLATGVCIEFAERV